MCLIFLIPFFFFFGALYKVHKITIWCLYVIKSQAIRRMRMEFVSHISETVCSVLETTFLHSWSPQVISLHLITMVTSDCTFKIWGSYSKDVNSGLLGCDAVLLLGSYQHLRGMCCLLLQGEVHRCPSYSDLLVKISSVSMFSSCTIFQSTDDNFSAFYILFLWFYHFSSLSDGQIVACNVFSSTF